MPPPFTLNAAPGRRRVLQAAGAAGLALAAPLVRANARLDVYSNSDANIVDFWSNVIKPGFERANAGVSLRIISTRSGGGIDAIASRAVAALATRRDPQFDYAESYDPRNSPEAMSAGLWTDWSRASLANLDKLDRVNIQTPLGLAYRGSQVVLAFDTRKLKPADAPRNWAALTAWMQRNPGQFIYNRPDKGGAGENFVRRAIHEANGRDPSLFTHDNFSEALAARRLPGAWALLRALAPFLYEKGAYTSGNAASLQLLGQGVVTMVPAWSDQVQTAIKAGVLPDSIAVAQLQDLGFSGGFSKTVVPVNARHHAWALKLADYTLSPEIQARIVTELGGLPGIEWKHLPAAVQQRHAPKQAAAIPDFPRGPWSAAVNDGWYREVAPQASRR